MKLVLAGKSAVSHGGRSAKRPAAVVMIALSVVLFAFAGIVGQGCRSAENNPEKTQSQSDAASVGVEKPAESIGGKNTEIDPLDFVNAEMKNNTDLVRWAEMALRQHWGYVWGTFGQVLDETLLNYKIEQYPKAVSPEESFIRQNWVGGRAADCIGLIKGYLWYNADTGSIDYTAYGLPDVDAGGLYDLAAVKGGIETIPDIPGIAVYIQGRHIGIYVGNGEVIHAMDTEHGVVKSKLAGGSWTHWLEVPGVEYTTE